MHALLDHYQHAHLSASAPHNFKIPAESATAIATKCEIPAESATTIVPPIRKFRQNRQPHWNERGAAR
ncbi:MAG TPA: hypothetical protein VKQ30_08450 [Ktedonobacterales bacterium]|nr:hypothetical protein [Ktedonobacterales bacterium]